MALVSLFSDMPVSTVGFYHGVKLKIDVQLVEMK